MRKLYRMILLLGMLGGTAYAGEHASFRGVQIGMTVDELRHQFPKDGMIIEGPDNRGMPPGIDTFWIKSSLGVVGEALVSHGVVFRLRLDADFFNFNPVSLQEFIDKLCSQHGCENMSESNDDGVDVVVARLSTGEAIRFRGSSIVVQESSGSRPRRPRPRRRGTAAPPL